MQEGPKTTSRKFVRQQSVVWSNDPTSERAKGEWVVQAPAGTEIELVAMHERAGIVRTKVVLGY